MTFHLLRSALLAAALFAGTNARAEGVTLTIENVRSAQGTIIVLVFDDASAFDRLDDRYAVDYADIPAQPGQVEVTFPSLSAGPYALFLFHDENRDQDLNYVGNRLLEGVGASGAPNPEDIPSFAEAAVFPGSATVILHYDQ